MNDIRKESCGEQGGALSEPQHRPRAAATRLGVKAPNDVKHGKAGTRGRKGDHPPEAASRGEEERRSSGAARGDYEAFVPSKSVWILLVATWKSTSLLPARLVPDDNIKSRSLIG